MNLRSVFALTGLVVLTALAPTASAQELGISFQKKNVSVGISLGHGHRPAPCPPRGIGHERREWIPSHYETIREQVYVPGREERVFVPAVYEWRQDHCGRLVSVLVCAAHYETRCTSGHYEVVTRQVWVEGGWRVRHCR